jgi:DNA-binding NtrC family response regulator
MVEIRMPRLEERKEDLPLLERHFVARFAAQYQKEIRGLSHRARMALATHSWPGNVRELENVLGHACMMAMGDTVDAQDLPAYLSVPDHTGSAVTSAAGPEQGALEEQERLLVQRAMESAGGNQSEAARILRIGRDALRYKLKKYNLDAGGRGAGR